MSRFILEKKGGILMPRLIITSILLGIGLAMDACAVSMANGLKEPKMKVNKILFIATGALLSTVSSGQGESIPCISHAVAIENI